MHFAEHFKLKLAAVYSPARLERESRKRFIFNPLQHDLTGESSKFCGSMVLSLLTV